MDAYYQHMNSMPDDLRAIHDQYWDYCGRPIYDDSYGRATVAVLKSSGTFTEFADKMNRMLFIPQDDDFLTAAYFFFVSGVKSVRDKIPSAE